MPYGEGVLGGCFRGTFMLIVQLYVMLLKNQAYPGTRAEQASPATPVRALSASLASRQVVQPIPPISTAPALYLLTLFPRRDLGRDGDMRMVALRRSVHRGEW